MVGVPRGRQPRGPEPRGRGQGQLERHPLGQGGFGQPGVGRHKLGAQNFFQFRQHLVRVVGGDRQVNGAGHFQAAAHRAGHLEPEDAGDAPPPGRQGFGQGQEIP